MASAMPVLPLVGSRMVLPGKRAPSRSACSIILSAMRSLMLPVGLKPSSLAKIFTLGLGLSRRISTIGVRPIKSRMLAAGGSSGGKSGMAWAGVQGSSSAAERSSRTRPEIEEPALLDDLGDFRRHHVLPTRVAILDAAEHLGREDVEDLGIVVF